MQLYIMRHGDAVQYARTDADRPLSDLGRQQVVRMLDHIRLKPPVRVIASPYLRAQQTARILCDGLGIVPLETVDGITPDNDPFEALKKIEQYQADPLLMVSHQPLVGSLLGVLLEGSVSAGQMMGTGSVALLSCPCIGAGQAQLQWLQHPR
ncbi:MAG: phosphohistidine phosphatase SixA [Gammaproteobacteria bacterium]|nr:phosphohistidine phosphatase SixA [Gammaproteobacteria bacterium]